MENCLLSMYNYLWRKKSPIKTLLAADLPSDQLKQKHKGAQPVVTTLKKKTRINITLLQY